MHDYTDLLGDTYLDLHTYIGTCKFSLMSIIIYTYLDLHTKVYSRNTYTHNTAYYMPTSIHSHIGVYVHICKCM